VQITAPTSHPIMSAGLREHHFKTWYRVRTWRGFLGGVIEYICNARAPPRFFDGFLGRELLHVATSKESGRCERERWTTEPLVPKLNFTVLVPQSAAKLATGFECHARGCEVGFGKVVSIVVYPPHPGGTRAVSHPRAQAFFLGPYFQCVHGIIF
jgi:hypothetical protein